VSGSAVPTVLIAIVSFRGGVGVDFDVDDDVDDDVAAVAIVSLVLELVFVNSPPSCCSESNNWDDDE